LKIRICFCSIQGGIMMPKKYVVRLSDEERSQLSAMVKKGKGAAYRIRHANILLKVDAAGPGWTDEDVAAAFGCHLNTVANVRRRLVEGGLEAGLERKPQENPSRERVFDGKGEAQLIATACSEPPDGCAKWTLQLLADRMVALKVVESVSRKTVERTLKNTNCSLTVRSAG
jgi:transposase